MKGKKTESNFGFGSTIAGAALLTVSGVASAGLIDFKVGGNTIGDIASLDWKPGSSYTIGGTGATLENGDILDTYIHGSLGSFLDTNGQAITNNFGLNSAYEVTFVGGFEETVFGISDSLNPVTNELLQSLNFASNDSSVNFFEIWLDFNVDSNALEGTGYNNGTLIAAGVVQSGGSGVVTSNFAFSGDPNNPISQDPNDYVLLDQFGVDNWAGIKTNEGIGGSQFLALASSFLDTSVIQPKTGVEGTKWDGDPILFSFNASQKVAFNETNPSRQFIDENGNIVVANVSPINGINGDGVLLQVDGNSSFTVGSTPVPEPSILVLFGAGFLAAGAVSLKRKGKKG